MAMGRAYLVETIPQGLTDLKGPPGVADTAEVLRRFVERARLSIDLMAMYWTLIPDPGSGDVAGLTPEDLDRLGAGEGRALYQALQAAAARGVLVRILQGPGFAPGGNRESDDLQRDHPGTVEVVTVDMADWYGAGVMHQKLWIVDGAHLYVGSANMDWRSLTQVKELGVAVELCPELAEDATRYFNAWWAFGKLAPETAIAFDPGARIWRGVPAWSELVPAPARKPSPLDDDRFAAQFDQDHPLRVDVDGRAAGVYLTGCPREVRGRGRTFDGDAWVRTILDAGQSVSVSVMDFAPVGLYPRKDRGVPLPESPDLGNENVWWPDVFDALLRAALTQRAHVRVLVSMWAMTSGVVLAYLRVLDRAARGVLEARHGSAGRLDIKLFTVPGWDSTWDERRSYPRYSRVNHAKYVVTDRRANVGTSNLTAEYFLGTAGTSLNTDHPGLVRDLQAVFDRDWHSPHASPLPPG